MRINRAALTGQMHKFTKRAADGMIFEYNTATNSRMWFNIFICALVTISSFVVQIHE